jgi:hypothetical protein
MSVWDAGPPQAEGSGLDPVVLEAQERWEVANNWFSDARRNWLEDWKFANADPYNLDQWPNSIRRARDYDDKPVLTTNKVRQHNLEITNKMKRAKPSIKARPTGNGATVEAATIYEGWFRQVEYQSMGPYHYDRAGRFMVNGGIGYLRVQTEWEPGGFVQRAKINSISDPLTVFFDRDAREIDKSDMNYALLFEDQDREEFKKENPKWAKYATDESLVEGTDWVSSDRVRKCEYYRRVFSNNKLFTYKSTQTGEDRIVSEASMKELGGEALIAQLEEQAKDKNSGVRMRVEEKIAVEWYYIIGNHIVEKEDWPGTTIPLVPMIAEEVITDGILDWKSHTRCMIDPQRMFNFWSSTAVEYGANQTKTPWIAPSQAIEGFEVYWNNANRVSNAVLPYNALADDGTTVIPPPQRIEPPVPAPVALKGMEIATTDMMAASGQGANTMDQQGNERTGTAIDSRMDQAETATFHFFEAQNIAVARIGKILLEIAPAILDTERLLMCLADDGMSYQVMIDPQQQQAHLQKQQYNQQMVQQVLFNPAVGTYEIQVDTGPDFGTRRREAREGLQGLITQAPQYAPVIGDLLVKNMDFDQADEAAARLRRMVPPHALGEGPSVTEQALMQQVQGMQQTIQQVMEELSTEKIKSKSKDARMQVESFRALTERLKMLFESMNKTKQTEINAREVPGGEGAKSAVDSGMSTKELELLMAQAFKEVFNVSLDPVVDAVEPGLEAAAVAGQPGGIDIGAMLNGGAHPNIKVGADGRAYARDYSMAPGYRAV